MFVPYAQYLSSGRAAYNWIATTFSYIILAYVMGFSFFFSFVALIILLVQTQSLSHHPFSMLG